MLVKKKGGISQTPQNPSNQNGSEPTLSHRSLCQPSPYYWGETACPVFRALSLKILYFWEVTHVTESAVGPENEETTILQQLLPHPQKKLNL
jgi:hypothetical protein